MPHKRFNPIIRKMESVFPLSEDEKAALSDLPIQITEIAKGRDIVRQGDRPTQSFALLQGFTCNYKMAGSGGREIVSVHVSGDWPDLQSLHLPVLDFSIMSLSVCQVAFISHGALLSVCDQHPRIAAAIWRESLVEASIGREWLLNIGQRSATQRIAHLLCEMMTRMRRSGLAQGDSCELPLTQRDLADVTGITVVHVNRCIKELRSTGLIHLDGKRLDVLDWTGLQEAADFDASYLHFVQPQSLDFCKLSSA